MGSTVPGSGARAVDTVVENARAPENDVGLAPPPPATRRQKELARWAACVVLGLVLMVAAWATFRPRAAIALDVGSMPDDSLALSGLVLYCGEPVQRGTMHLAVSSVDTKYHLASVTLAVKAGRFSSLEKAAAFRD